MLISMEMPIPRTCCVEERGYAGRLRETTRAQRAPASSTLDFNLCPYPGSHPPSFS